MLLSRFVTAGKTDLCVYQESVNGLIVVMGKTSDINVEYILNILLYLSFLETELDMSGCKVR